MLEKKYVDFLEKVVGIYKDFEHEKIKEIKGVEVDKLVDGTEEYLKRLKDLKEEIEKKAQEKTIDQVIDDNKKVAADYLAGKEAALKFLTASLSEPMSVKTAASTSVTPRRGRDSTMEKVNSFQ